MASFESLGLRASLLGALEDSEFEQPTALQEAIVPVLRRGGNVVARAASGSGKTLAVALGVLDRIEPRAEDAEGAGARVLVLTATAETAERAGTEMLPWAHAAGLMLAVPGGAWGTPLNEADVVVATPAEALRAVRASELKMEALDALVVDGASDVARVGEWDALETLFDHLPRDAQRVVFSVEMDEQVEDLAERRIKRPVRYPPRPAVPEEAAAPEPRGTLGYVVVPAREKLDTLARLLGDAAAPTVLGRTDERAAELAERLAERGFAVGDVGEQGTDVAVPSAATARDEIGPEATVISYDVPPDERTLLARHAGGAEPGFVFVQPRELPHLRQLAERTGFTLNAAGLQGENAAAATMLAAFRRQIRRALAEEDLGAQMLVLEPLLEEHSAAEVAAACAALLRRRAPAPAATAPAEAMSAATPATTVPRTTALRDGGAQIGPAPAPTVRLFVGVGERDGTRPGDLVGAIAGEAGIPGSRIGRIEIRDSFSIVEVPAELAEQVIRTVNGTTVKGRSVRVDYDRARRPGGSSAAGPARLRARRPDASSDDRGARRGPRP